MSRILLASTSHLKFKALQEVCNIYNTPLAISTIKVSSDVNEQPVGEETIIGCFNRIRNASSKNVDNDIKYIIAIENGIFYRNNEYVDIAVCGILEVESGIIELGYSDPVKFPLDCVKDAEIRGFNHTTVGDVMKERGLILDSKDPYISLCGVSRKTFIVETLIPLFKRCNITNE